MATELSASVGISGSSRLDDNGRAVYVPTAPVQFGAGGWDAMETAFTDGTGDSQANKQYCEQLTVSASSSLDINLNGSTLVNGLNLTLNFTAIKWATFSIVSADGSKRLYIGPQGVANAAQLWFGGVGATVYEVVWSYVTRVHPWTAGWPLTVGNGILRFTNPTAGAVLCNVLLVGI